MRRMMLTMGGKASMPPFVLVATDVNYDSYSFTYPFYSSDGITAKAQNLFYGGGYNGITYAMERGGTDGNILVALHGELSDDVYGHVRASSDNGVTWSDWVDLEAGGQWVNCYIKWISGVGLFALLMYNNQDKSYRVMTSPDGLTWTQRGETIDPPRYISDYARATGLLYAKNLNKIAILWESGELTYSIATNLPSMGPNFSWESASSPSGYSWVPYSKVDGTRYASFSYWGFATDDHIYACGFENARNFVKDIRIAPGIWDGFSWDTSGDTGNPPYVSGDLVHVKAASIADKDFAFAYVTGGSYEQAYVTTDGGHTWANAGFHLYPLDAAYNESLDMYVVVGGGPATDSNYEESTVDGGLAWAYAFGSSPTDWQAGSSTWPPGWGGSGDGQAYAAVFAYS